MSEFADILQQALAPGYTLERELSGGGMSRVFVATDVALSRKVVVKVLPPELAAGVNHERFRREIQVAAQLQHPHVVPLLSAGEQGTLIWYTMPFIQGHSLRETLSRGDKYAIKDVVRIMRDVAEALDYAHGLGVIHRDIKPGNVLLMGSHALVTDFGVAKAISASMPTSGFTSAGMAIGTPAYMAPEQIAADPAADHRMDLYALGLLGYEMLTGQVPFKEDSPQKTMAAQLTRDPAPLEQSRGDVPAPLSALIRRLLAKQPEERPQVASEVVAALDEIAFTSGQHLAPLRAVKKPSLGRTLLVVAAGIAVIASAWFAGEQRATSTVSAALRDSLATADSMSVVAAQAAAMLTREDSMAIAKAVSARMAQRTAPAATVASGNGVASPASGTSRTDSAALIAMADSIRQQIQRTVLDSLVQFGMRVGNGTFRVVDGAGRAQAMTEADARAIAQSIEAIAPVASTGTSPRTPNTPGARSGGPRRVVVAPPRPSRSRPDLDKVAMALVDSLRARVDDSPRYVVVPADSVAAALSVSRTINTLHERLEADFIISIALIPAKDSLVRLITVHDMGAPQGMDRRVLASSVAATDPFASLGASMPQVVPLMMEMERARFRMTPLFPGGPNGQRGRDPRDVQVRTMTAPPPGAPRPPDPKIP